MQRFSVHGYPRTLPVMSLGMSIALPILVVILLLIPPATYAEVTIQGHLEHQEDLKSSGQVVDGLTGQPIPGAQVALPDMGYTTQTDRQGRYRIPATRGPNSVIMSVQKPGYAPFSISISKSTEPTMLIRLSKQPHMLVLDDQLRHLGDGSFSPDSSNAFSFRKPADGPGLRIPFSLEGLGISESPVLQIGSIIGLDTRMAHLLSLSRINSAASPLLIKLNGTVIAQIQVNGDNQKIRLPKPILRANGINILEIEAGFHFVEAKGLDYDDMELMHIVVFP